MKKILVLLGAIATVASSSATVISCGVSSRFVLARIQSNSIDDLELPVDIDNDSQNNYFDIKEKVSRLINSVNPEAKFGIDYKIAKTGFSLSDGKALYPNRVKVSAIETSNLLTGSFDALIYKDLNQVILDAKIPTQGNYNQGIEIKNQILEMLEKLEPYIKEGIDYKIEEDEATDTWSVHSLSEESLVKVNFSYKERIQIFDLMNLTGKIEDLIVGQTTFGELKTSIVNFINQNAQNVKEGIDYEIIGDVNTGGSQILVKSISSSKRLIGQFTIQVNKVNIDETKIATLDILATRDDIETAVKNQISNDLIEHDFYLKLGIDYVINQLDQHWVEVKALPKSNYLSGGFKFQLEKVSLASLDKTTAHDLWNGSTDEHVTEFVENLINTELLSKGKPNQKVTTFDYEIETKDTMTRIIYASDDSHFIKDQFELLLGTFDISTIEIPGLLVGEKSFANLKTEVINKINAEIGNSSKFIKEEDLNFDDETNQMSEAGTITISSNTTQLTGQILITINKRDISNNPRMHFIMDEAASIEQKVLDQINASFINNGLAVEATRSDFDIVWRSKNNYMVTNAQWWAGNYLVKASKNSKLIIGQFEFFVDKYDIANEKVETLTIGTNVKDYIDKLMGNVYKKLLYSTSINETEYAIFDETNNGLKAGKVILKSYETSNVITGNLTITVQPHDLSTIKLSNSGEEFTTTRNNLSAVKKTISEKINNLFIDSYAPIKLNWDVDYALFDQNGERIVEADETGNLIYLYPAGKYSVRPLNNDYLINELTFTIVPSKLDNKDFKDYTVGKDSPENILEAIAANVNINAGLVTGYNGHQLKNNVDYQILDQTGKIKDLEKAGIVTVKPINNDYLSNQVEFTINKYDLKMYFDDTDLQKFNALLSFEQAVKMIEDALNKATNLDNKIKFETDFTLNAVDKWATEGITITSTNSSDYITENYNFELQPVSLTELNNNFQTRTFALNDKFEDAKDYIVSTMNRIFINAAIKPVLDKDYDVIGPATQTYNGQLVISGPNALLINPNSNSILFDEQASINVNALKAPNNLSKDTVYEITTNNYVLTPTLSTYTTDNSYGRTSSKQLDTVNTRQGVIKNSEILAISRFFLVTTRGIFLGEKLIAGTGTLNLKYEDLLAITDNYVLTTKGSWYLTNVSNDNSTTWTAAAFTEPIFSNLTKDDLLAATNNNLIVTTKGVYRGLITNNNSKVISSFVRLSIPDIEFKDNLLNANERFIVTKKGIWVIPLLTSSSSIIKVNLSINDPKDILQFSTGYVAIKDFGLINNQGIVEKNVNLTDNPLPLGEEVLAKTKNYLITTSNIYWQGNLINNAMNLTKTDIVKATDDFLITKTRLYWHDQKVIKDGSETFRFAIGDFIYANATFLVMKQGIQFQDNSNQVLFGDLTLTRFSLNNRVRETDLMHNDEGNITGITNSFIATKKGAWYKQPGTSEIITTGLNNLTDNTFLVANDYFLVTATQTWAMNSAENRIARLGKGLNKDDYSPFNNLTKDDILGINGSVVLIREAGFFYYDDPYWTSEYNNNRINWTQDDIVRIGDQGQILTKTKVWFHWNVNPISII